jgi:hypothetical protein
MKSSSETKGRGVVCAWFACTLACVSVLASRRACNSVNSRAHVCAGGHTHTHSHDHGKEGI